MSIITLTTDFGRKDHYVAALKGSIYSQHPNAQIVDISHEISPFSVSEAAFTLNQAFHHFPKGSIHIIGVNSLENKVSFLLLKFNEHWFISADTGIFNLICRNQKASEIYEIFLESPNGIYQNFPELKIMTNVAAHLAQGGDPARVGRSVETFRKGLIPAPMVSDNSISTTVLHIDHYGNAIINIDKQLFQDTRGERAFSITIGRGDAISKFVSYDEGTPGDILCTFNSSELLQIGIKLGSAEQLLGLNSDQRILIDFGL